MARNQRVAELTRCLRLGGGCDDEITSTLRLQQLQLEAAHSQCRHIDTLLEKLDAATETLRRYCEPDCSRTRSQREYKLRERLEKKTDLHLREQQLQKEQCQLLPNYVGLQQEETSGQDSVEKVAAEIYEEMENELYQKLLIKLEKDEQKQSKTELEQTLQTEQLQQMAKEPGQHQEGVQEGQLQEEPDLQLDTGSEKQLERTVEQQPHSHQPSTKRRWCIAALCLTGVSLLICGLLPCLCSVIGEPRLVHLRPPPF